MSRYLTAALAATSTLLLTTCAGGPAADPPGTKCETSVTTAGGSRVHAFILRGEVTCEQAVRVLRGYFLALERGEAPGMGGGGPVPVGDWICISGPSTNPGTSCSTRDGKAIETELVE